MIKSICLVPRDRREMRSRASSLFFPRNSLGFSTNQIFFLASFFLQIISWYGCMIVLIFNFTFVNRVRSQLRLCMDKKYLRFTILNSNAKLKSQVVNKCKIHDKKITFHYSYMYVLQSTLLQSHTAKGNSWYVTYRFLLFLARFNCTCNKRKRLFNYVSWVLLMSLKILLKKREKNNCTAEKWKKQTERKEDALVKEKAR